MNADNSTIAREFNKKPIERNNHTRNNPPLEATIILLNRYLLHLALGSREDWIATGTALKNEYGDEALLAWLDWSSSYEGYNETEARKQWASFSLNSTHYGYIVNQANLIGGECVKFLNASRPSNTGYTPLTYSPSKTKTTTARNKALAQKAKKAEEQKRDISQQSIKAAKALLSVCQSAPSSNPYYVSKDIKDVFFDIKSTTAKIDLQRQYVAPNALIIPVRDYFTNELISYQFINPDAGKYMLKGASLKNASYTLKGIDRKVILCEGLADAYTVSKATGFTTVCAFSKHGVKSLALEMIRRGADPKAIYLGLDNDAEKEGRELAREYGFKLFIPPASGKDWNDLGVMTCRDLFDGSGTNLEQLEKNKFNTAITDDMLSKVHNSTRITINQRYLDVMIKKSLDSLNVRFLIVKSDMKTGKTTSAKKLITTDAAVLIIMPRRMLNRSTASELGLNYYEDVKKEKNQAKKKEMAKRMTCTPQSLVELLKSFPSIKFDHIFLDESEAISSMLLSSVTRDKTATLETLVTACQRAGAVLLMDAHAGAKTNRLASILAGRVDIAYLMNEYKAWKGFKAKIITGKTVGKNGERALNYSESVDAALVLVKQDLDKGKRLFIAPSSKDETIRLYKMLKRQYPNLNILKIHSGTAKTEGKEIEQLMANPNEIIKYDVLIANSAIAVGVSFNPPKAHFHKAYGFFSNTVNTGEPDDSIQHIARVRELTDGEWVFVVQKSTPYRNCAESEEDIKSALYNRKKDATTADKATIKTYSDIYSEISSPNFLEASESERNLVNLFAVCEMERINTKNNFLSCFLGRLEDMGVEYKNTEYTPDTLPDQKSLRQARAALKKDKEKIEIIQKALGVKLPFDEYRELEEKKELKGLSHAELVERARDFVEPINLTEEDYERAKANIKFNNEVPESTRGAMDKFRTEQKYSFKFDELSSEELEEKLSLISRNAAQCCYYREMVTLSPKEMTKFLNKYGIALIYGIGAEGFFKRDILSKKLNVKMIYKTLVHANPYMEGKLFSNKILKRQNSMLAHLRRNMKNMRALGMFKNIPANYQKNPVGALRALLNMMGFEIVKKKKRIGKKFEWQYSAKRTPMIEAYYNQRQVEGMNWVERIEKLMDEFKEVKTRLTDVFQGFEVTPANFEDLQLIRKNTPKDELKNFSVFVKGMYDNHDPVHTAKVIRQEALKYR